jgi:hypothetical protein
VRIKPHFSALKIISPVSNCISFEQLSADRFEGSAAKRLNAFAFSFPQALARFMQETDRSVSYPKGEK